MRLNSINRNSSRLPRVWRVGSIPESSHTSHPWLKSRPHSTSSGKRLTGWQRHWTKRLMKRVLRWRLRQESNRQWASTLPQNLAWEDRTQPSRLMPLRERLAKWNLLSWPKTAHLTVRTYSITSWLTSWLVPYLPKKDQDSLVFYGTQKFYVFLRFFYTLYERVLKAWELCHKIDENDKTRSLSKE